MEIEKGTLPNEQPFIRFKDQFDETCRLSLSGARTPFLKFSIVGQPSTQFSQEDIKTLLPHLQSFAETGQLEPQEPTLQGEDDKDLDACEFREACYALQEETELATMQEAGVAMAANIVEQGKRIQALVETTARMNFKNYEQEKRIQALEQLLQKWRSFGMTSEVKVSDEWRELDVETYHLLYGE